MTSTNDIITIAFEDEVSQGTDRHSVYARYPSQSKPQDGQICLNCETGSVWACYNTEVGSAVTMDEYHGHIQTFNVPAYTSGATLNWLMEHLRPEFERIVSGYTSEWNGSNHVARFSIEAAETLDRLHMDSASASGVFDIDEEPCDGECDVCWGDDE